MDFLYFLGRFHVLVLHLPIGIVLIAIVLDFIARRPRFRPLAAASAFLWGAAALTAIVTAMLGYLHYLEGGFAGNTAIIHMVLGTSTAVGSALVWILRTREVVLPRVLHDGIAAVLLLLIVLTGHYGGNLTHGSEYLLEYAPTPIRALAGLPPRRPPVTVLAEAEIFLDVIHPMFRARCTGCHNNDRRRAGLSLMSYEALRRGGEYGSVVLAGRPESSELYRRISLPAHDEAFMPAEGNTPLTPEQVDLVRWWIDLGIPESGLLRTLEYAAVESQLRAVLNLEGSS